MSPPARTARNHTASPIPPGAAGGLLQSDRRPASRSRMIIVESHHPHRGFSRRECTTPSDVVETTMSLLYAAHLVRWVSPAGNRPSSEDVQGVVDNADPISPTTSKRCSRR